MFMVFCTNDYGDRLFRGEGETLREAYEDLRLLLGDDEDMPANLSWYRVEPIKVKIETRFVEE